MAHRTHSGPAKIRQDQPSMQKTPRPVRRTRGSKSFFEKPKQSELMPKHKAVCVYGIRIYTVFGLNRRFYVNFFQEKLIQDPKLNEN